MRGRLIWAGALAVGLAALGACFVFVGLDRADKLASVLGGLAGLAALGLAVYGFTRRPPEEPSPAPAPPHGDVTNTITGTVHGPAFQGHDFHGPITLGPSPEPGKDPEKPA